MKKTILLTLAAAVCLTLGACHKTCTCLGYDGLEHSFTPDEVDSRTGGDCSKMRNFPFYDHYSVCSWE